MNKKAKKAYDKAMDCYERGKINRALELCEDALSEGLDNSVVLNFKGLLLYQKGNLNEAITVWKINKEINGDNVAENYIRDAAMDEKRLVLYKQAEQALKQLKIDMALESFKRCAESDFNCIKVNTGIALCYQKKGDFYRAKEYVENVLSIDSDAITAKIIEKELGDNGIYLDSKKDSKNFLIRIIVIFVVIVIGIGGYLLMWKFRSINQVNNVEQTKDNEIQLQDSTNNENKKLDVQEKILTNSNTKSDEKPEEQMQGINFNKEKLKILISNKDLDGIYEQLKSVKESSINVEDKELYKNAIGLMENEGVSKFYEYGLEDFNKGNYLKAKDELDKAYNYCQGNDLKEHILFYRASNSYNLSENDTAMGQFEEYYNQYPNGVYIQEALYDLTLLSNQVDEQKGKKYANILIKNFPDSIYANDNIKNIARH